LKILISTLKQYWL